MRVKFNITYNKRVKTVNFLPSVIFHYVDLESYGKKGFLRFKFLVFSIHFKIINK